VSALEQPLDRVNYFNGQRLDAADFRADQDYQMRVRRKLFSSLYSIGIVQGLEVNKHPSDPHKVRVAPGVALDFMGREIILLDPSDVQVAGTPSPSPGVIFGNFLVIAYAEQRVQPVNEGCVASSAAGGCGGNLVWGAPTRIRAAPKLEMVDTWPSDQSGRIVLAQIGLTAGCQVSEIQSGVRRYAVAAQPPTVHPISLEGEKDIDAKNAKVLFFHIDGGVPDTVTLYLRGAQFSTLFYSELGQHGHDNNLTSDQITVPKHHHTLTNIALSDAVQDNGKPLGLSASTWNDDKDYSVRLWGNADENDRHRQDLTQITSNDGQPVVALVNFGAHTHTFPSQAQTDDADAVQLTLPTVVIHPTGLLPTGVTVRTTGQALGYIDSLSVLYDGQDITDQILKQLTGIDPTNWPANTAKLGDGQSTHPLVAHGTGKIDLSQLGLDFTPGEHSLTFQVSGAGNGGQIKYNLYVA
jgi:hypothetical protein